MSPLVIRPGLEPGTY